MTGDAGAGAGAGGKKECPNCAVDIPENASVCPVCRYEFPRRSPLPWKPVALLLLAVLLIPLLRMLLRLAAGR